MSLRMQAIKAPTSSSMKGWLTSSPRLKLGALRRLDR